MLERTSIKLAVFKQHFHMPTDNLVTQNICSDKDKSAINCNLINIIRVGGVETMELLSKKIRKISQKLPPIKHSGMPKLKYLKSKYDLQVKDIYKRLSISDQA